MGRRGGVHDILVFSHFLPLLERVVSHRGRTLGACARVIYGARIPRANMSLQVATRCNALDYTGIVGM